jgi:hypothetical protein
MTKTRKKVKKNDLILACQEAAKNRRLKNDNIFQSILKLSEMQMSNHEIEECIKEVGNLTKIYK